jgi:hypothetical protein
MGADLSRIRSNPLLDFSGVELKQGGVLLDADFNELVAVVDRRVRALASDALGRSRVSSTTPDAFRLSIVAGSVAIGKGRLYVDGLLAENHGAASADAAKKLFDPLLSETHFADAVAYDAQPYLPAAPGLPEAGTHLVYLDVWERELTHIERPELVETAVAVDTSSRLQTVWQVRVLEPNVQGASCDTPHGELPGWATLIAPSTGRMTTGTYDVPPEDDPCELAPSGGYRGLENQTYRVEIHEGGAPGGTATFKWSRENSSVGARVASVVSAAELELQTLGRDEVLRFNTGDWVEVTDDVRELSQRCGEMRKISVNEAARRITFSPALPADMTPGAFPDSDFPSARNLRVRRWDHKHTVLRTAAGGTTAVHQDLDAGTSGVINVPAAGTTLLLENGVTVSFASTGAKGFRAGDYWVFAARTADASVEILEDAPPRGIHHHYERLGIWDVGAGTVTDCREPWPPAVSQGADCSCTACVTSESHASGQFTIQDAVNQVRETGGTVCIGPGQFALREPVRIVNARSLRVRGQGPATMIVSTGGAFAVQTGIAVTIENLAILSVGREAAISVRTAIVLELRGLVIVMLAGNDARGAAIALQGVIAAASIRGNAILAPLGIASSASGTSSPREDGERASFLLTAGFAVEDNILWCQRQAVSLDEGVLHMLGTRIAANEVLACSEFGISTLGLGAPGSSMMVSRNNVTVNGSGIRCGVDGLWIDGNKVSNNATGAAAARAGTVGIALATGLDRNGPEQCQILANQVSGFTNAGILIGAATRELIVKLNLIEGCGSGILSADDADGGSISIENNHIRNIGPAGEGSATSVIGIGVSRADSATIAGNMMRGIGVRTVQAGLRAGVLATGVLRARIHGNEVVELAPPGDFTGLSAGIMVRAPYAEFDVVNNHVQRDADASTQGSNGAWSALLTQQADTREGVLRGGNFASVRLDTGRMLVLEGGRAYVARLGGAAGTDGAAAELPRGSVLGNVLQSRGIASAVELAAEGECLFNDNRVDARGLSRVAAVRMSTSVAIVSGNRVRGGELSIQVIGAESAAVLGNVTTGSIAVPGGLNPPWDALNLRA